jgi:hypothetical protein
MIPDQENKFSAAASTIGYLYQCRFALLDGLRRLRRGEQFIVSLETLDDVVFEQDGKPPELLQMKHHLKQSADLSDASVDIWKSLRIWSVGLKDGTIVKGAILFLVTTSQASKGSAAEYMRPDKSRDPAKALERLTATSTTSTNPTNALAYDAFRALSQIQRTQLVDSIFIIDRAPTIDEINNELRQVLFSAAEHKFLPSFIQRLEGWWLTRVIRHLTKSDSKPILSDEFSAEITELREQFKQDSLPIDDDIMKASIDALGYQDRTFVEQLRLIEIGNPRIVYAIKNYFRAFEHRSRWLREDLLGIGELEKYEDALFEEWDIHFQEMKEELGEEPTEEIMKNAARALYKWVEIGTHPRIRSGVVEPSIPRGTFQILSDSQRLGWHVKFRERLQNVLEPKEVQQ